MCGFESWRQQLAALATLTAEDRAVEGRVVATAPHLRLGEALRDGNRDDTNRCR
jgi:hypothetical protein